MSFVYIISSTSEVEIITLVLQVLAQSCPSRLKSQTQIYLTEKPVLVDYYTHRNPEHRNLYTDASLKLKILP